MVLVFDSISALCSFQCSRALSQGALLSYRSFVRLSTPFFFFPDAFSGRTARTASSYYSFSSPFVKRFLCFLWITCSFFIHTNLISIHKWGDLLIIIAIRTVLLYVAALIVVRLMGRGELSKLDPFQTVVLFMIAELASLSIESPNISVFTGLTALLTLLFLQVLFSFIRSEERR